MFKQKSQHSNFFFRVKVDAPLTPTYIKFLLLNQRKEAKFVIASFL